MPTVDHASGLRVLIVEDDDNRRELLRASFEGREGEFGVSFVSSVASARRRLRARSTDIILASALVSDGPASALAGDPDFEEVPLVVMTRPGEDATALAALNEGAFARVVIGEETLERLPGIISRFHQNWLRDRGSAEVASELSQGLGAAALDAHPDGLLSYGSDRRIRFVNARGAAGLGLSPKEIVGLPVEELVPPALAAPIIAALDEVARSGSESRLECRYPDPEQERLSELRFLPVAAKSGVFEVLCVEREISEEKERAAASARSESRLHALFEALPLDLWFADETGTCVLQNERSLLTWGRLTGHPLKDSFPPALAESWSVADRKARRGQVVSGEVVVEARGRKSVLKTRVAPVRRDGEILGTLQIAMDLTRERKLELDIARLEDELLQAQKMQVLGQLTTGIAHDFKNVLTAIGGEVARARSAALGQTPDPSLLSECLGAIDDSVRRAAGLAEHLLGFGRHRVSRPEAIDLAESLPKMEGLLERLLTPNIRFGIYVMSGTRPLLLDPSQLEQLLLNLVVNARDAMPEGGDLMIKAWNARSEELDACSSEGVRLQEAVTLSVSDTGCGISPQIREKVFDAFFTTKAPGEGTGLGLSTTRSIVAKAKGCLLLETEMGVGTTFRAVLPTASPLPNRPAPAATPRPLSVSPGPKTIILCEDDDAVRGLMVRWLRDLGYRVLGTASPHRALAIAEEEKQIDLLITDMGMPEMSGVELRRLMRQRRPGLKALVVTGLDRSDLMPGDEEEDSLLPKPFDASGLFDAVRALTGEA